MSYVVECSLAQFKSAVAVAVPFQPLAHPQLTLWQSEKQRGPWCWASTVQWQLKHWYQHCFGYQSKTQHHNGCYKENWLHPSHAQYQLIKQDHYYSKHLLAHRSDTGKTIKIPTKRDRKLIHTRISADSRELSCEFKEPKDTSKDCTYIPVALDINAIVI